MPTRRRCYRQCINCSTRFVLPKRIVLETAQKHLRRLRRQDFSPADADAQEHRAPRANPERLAFGGGGNQVSARDRSGIADGRATLPKLTAGTVQRRLPERDPAVARAHLEKRIG